MKKESSECSRVWRNGREKKEERSIKKKRERVRVWRRKEEGKKKEKKEKKEMPCVEDKKRGGKKKRKKEKNEILSQYFHNKF